MPKVIDMIFYRPKDISKYLSSAGAKWRIFKKYLGLWHTEHGVFRLSVLFDSVFWLWLAVLKANGVWGMTYFESEFQRMAYFVDISRLMAHLWGRFVGVSGVWCSIQPNLNVCHVAYFGFVFSVRSGRRMTFSLFWSGIFLIGQGLTYLFFFVPRQPYSFRLHNNKESGDA